MANSPLHFVTQDASPTMGNESEWMHSPRGAFSETLLVYGSGIEWALEHKLPLSFGIVGLGMGYIEFLVVALCLKTSTKPERITSFETDEHLVKRLSEFINKGTPNIYWQILDYYRRYLNVSPEAIRGELQRLHQEKLWTIEGAWPPASDFQCATLLYDPYSRKADPALWEDTALKPIHNGVMTPGLVCSYAFNRNLRDALTAANFKLLPVHGHGKKRQRTFALRT